MKCFYHETVDAVATCQSCGKALCKQCASLYNPCTCDECVQLNEIEYEEQRERDKKNALIDTNLEFLFATIKGVVCAIILTFIFTSINGTPTPFIMSVMFFFVPFGWALITFIEQFIPIFFLSGLLFIFYIVFKLAFSIFLGIPCFLYQIIKYIVKLAKADRM